MPLTQEEIAKIKSGTHLKVWERVVGKDNKERETPFEGLVIARKHGTEVGATFTVRANIQNIGVEKVYPIYSPLIKRIEFLAVPKRRKRSKLYYFRDLSAKKIKDKLKKLYK